MLKNDQDANIRILRWRLKSSEYDYDVVYKTVKTNVNADALSRNPIGLLLGDSKIINTKTKLNSTDPENAETIRHLLKEYTEKSDDENAYNT